MTAYMKAPIVIELRAHIILLLFSLHFVLFKIFFNWCQLPPIIKRGDIELLWLWGDHTDHYMKPMNHVYCLFVNFLKIGYGVHVPAMKMQWLAKTLPATLKGAEIIAPKDKIKYEFSRCLMIFSHKHQRSCLDIISFIFLD